MVRMNLYLQSIQQKQCLPKSASSDFCVQKAQPQKLQKSFRLNSIGYENRQVVQQLNRDQYKSTNLFSDGLSPLIKVAVDVDEVLAQFLVTLNQYYKEKYGTEYQLKDFLKYVYAEVWKVSQEESAKIVHQFFKTKHFTSDLPPMPGSQQALQRLSEECQLAIVTSRQNAIQEPTQNWISTHFPNTFREVQFGNQWSLEGKQRSKIEICREIGAHLLIDDNPVYCMECSEGGIQSILFNYGNQYPWAKLVERDPNIHLASSWPEVEQIVRDVAIQNYQNYLKKKRTYTVQ